MSSGATCPRRPASRCNSTLSSERVSTSTATFGGASSPTASSTSLPTTPTPPASLLGLEAPSDLAVSSTFSNVAFFAPFSRVSFFAPSASRTERLSEMQGLRRVACTGKHSPSEQSTCTSPFRGLARSATILFRTSGPPMSSKLAEGCLWPSSAAELEGVSSRQTRIWVSAPIRPRHTCCCTMISASPVAACSLEPAASISCEETSASTPVTRSTSCSPLARSFGCPRSFICTSSASLRMFPNRSRRSCALRAYPSTQSVPGSPIFESAGLSSHASNNSAPSAPCVASKGSQVYSSCAQTRRLRHCTSVRQIRPSATCSEARAVSTTSEPGLRT
mmetsp:Transcript_10378/g.26114  ORF Transcript_10378/g.26114 Transcript_10378/m.26114 type:complete len:334 (-) Transcript_10378:376-1377(-)